MAYVPHTKEDVARLLSSLGLSSLKDVYSHLPLEILSTPPDVPGPIDEDGLRRHLYGLAAHNIAQEPGMCFAGGGAYDHFVPAAVDALANRSEFLTAYTPYQPEMSQGWLQAIYEYQSMMVSLTGMDVGNASMYDGATALYEAVLMSVRVTKDRHRAVVSEAVNPLHRKALKSYGTNLGLEIVEIPHKDGRDDVAALSAAVDVKTCSLVVAYPGFFGYLTDLSPLAEAAHAKNALLVVDVYPMALGVAKSPGAMGADIVAGEGQPFGIRLSWGGPYLGFLTTKKDYVRRMPGRIVGATEDTHHRRGFVLTLQTREQHIRREKAMSNICSNEAYAALRAAIYLTMVGPKGLKKIASLCMRNARDMKKKVLAVKGVAPLFRDGTAWFNEFAVKLPVAAEDVILKLCEDGTLAGISLGKLCPSLGENALLMTATEKNRPEDIDQFVEQFAGAVREAQR